MSTAKRLQAQQRLQTKLNSIIASQEDTEETAAYFHNILIHKIPYASRSNDWFLSKTEWKLVGYYHSDSPGDVFTLPSGKRMWSSYVKVLNPLSFLGNFGCADFFDFGNMPPKEQAQYPHKHDNNHCVCTHYITKVFVIWNQQTNTLCRIGSECIFQFASQEMVEQMEKISKLLVCTKCLHPFNENELKRVFPGKTLQQNDGTRKMATVQDVTGKRRQCYTCSVPSHERQIHRCRKCCNLISKDRLECDTNKCYYSIMYKSPLSYDSD